MKFMCVAKYSMDTFTTSKKSGLVVATIDDDDVVVANVRCPSSDEWSFEMRRPGDIVFTSMSSNYDNVI